jgi:hypothetical protein
MLLKMTKYFFTGLITFTILFRGEAVILASQVAYDTFQNNETDITLDNMELTLTSQVIAVIGRDLFIGEATGYVDGNGVVEVKSFKDPSIRCIGEYSYTSLELLSGKGTMTCNDGDRSEFNFRGFDNSKGYGYGTSNRGPVSFTYGIHAKDAGQYLFRKSNP